MTLSQPVIGARGQVLARSGVQLTEATLRALDSAEIESVEVADTDEGRRASAFAMYAESAYEYIECGKTALPVGQTDDAGAIRYDTCEEAIDADGGNYLFGIDPEYVWYEDRDGDGVSCEAR